MKQIRVHTKGCSIIPVVDVAQAGNLVLHLCRMRLHSSVVRKGACCIHRIGYGRLTRYAGIILICKIRKPNVVGFETAIHILRHGSDVVRVACVLLREICFELNVWRLDRQRMLLCHIIIEPKTIGALVNVVLFCRAIGINKFQVGIGSEIK